MDDETSFGLYMKDVGVRKVLDPEVAKALVAEAQQGSLEAREKVALHNQGLAIMLSKSYHRKYPLTPLEDIVQIANTGLLRAIDEYRPDRGTKFSYFAFKVMKRVLQDELNRTEHNIVHVPRTILVLARDLWKFVKNFQAQNTREPTHKEIMSGLGIGKDRLEDVLAYSPTVVSMDVSVKGDDKYGTPRAEMYNYEKVSDKPHDLIGELHSQAVSKALQEALASLAESGKGKRSRQIIIRYYGLNGQEPETLEAIGQSLGITRERVRQIKENALLFLRKQMNGAVSDH